MRIILKTMLIGSFAVACGPAEESPRTVKEDAHDLPLRNASPEERAQFVEGDAAFDLTYREADGLGPLYIRASCASCHEQGGRGPGAVQKMAAVGSDGFTPNHSVEFPFGHSVRPLLTSGAITPLVASADAKVTQRVGLPILGRGYLEAISDEAILAGEQAQRAGLNGISGRVNRVTWHSEGNPGQPFHSHQLGETNLIGRFGAKARVATLDDFTADAFVGDMGITSPLRPAELPNPDSLSDDGKPGTDVALDRVNAIADYMRLVEIPTRAPADSRGQAAFDSALCSSCHTPSLKTRADYPIAALANVDAPIYSDLLLHDLGSGLADGLEDESASSREWRTAPLIGLRFFRTYLHDGRASTVEDAIAQHRGDGSEANLSIDRFEALSAEDRAVLISFVSSL